MAENRDSKRNDDPTLKKLRKNQRRRSPFLKAVWFTFFAVLLIYSVNVIVSTQADIAEQKAAIEKLNAEIAEARQENDEYQRLLSGTDEYEYMLGAAIERGYAYPRERRFYPKNNPE